MKETQRKVLETLAQHPLLSRRQLELELGLRERLVRLHLAHLGERGLVRRYNAHWPGLMTRSL